MSARKPAVCTDCGAWPHLSACKWKGRPPEKVGWVWACAECGHVGSQVHHIACAEFPREPLDERFGVAVDDVIGDAAEELLGFLPSL